MSKIVLLEIPFSKSQIYIKKLNYFPNRDAIIYGTSCFTSGLPTVMKVLSQAVFQPQLTDQEVLLSNYMYIIWIVWWLICIKQIIRKVSKVIV